MKIVTFVLLAAVMVQPSPKAADFRQAYASGKQVTLVMTSGDVRKLREKYTVRDTRVAPDGMASAWLLADITLEEPAGEVGASTLVVYRKGKRRTVACGQLIREYWFVENGRKIAYDCGGRHFAGNEVLFDTRTLKEISRFHQSDVATDKRPAWSAASADSPEK